MTSTPQSRPTPTHSDRGGPVSRRPPPPKRGNFGDRLSGTVCSSPAGRPPPPKRSPAAPLSQKEGSEILSRQDPSDPHEGTRTDDISAEAAESASGEEDAEQPTFPVVAGEDNEIGNKTGQATLKTNSIVTQDAVSDAHDIQDEPQSPRPEDSKNADIISDVIRFSTPSGAPRRQPIVVSMMDLWHLTIFVRHQNGSSQGEEILVTNIDATRTTIADLMRLVCNTIHVASTECRLLTLAPYSSVPLKEGDVLIRCPIRSGDCLEFQSILTSQIQPPLSPSNGCISPQRDPFYYTGGGLLSPTPSYLTNRGSERAPIWDDCSIWNQKAAENREEDHSTRFRSPQPVDISERGSRPVLSPADPRRCLLLNPISQTHSFKEYELISSASLGPLLPRPSVRIGNDLFTARTPEEQRLVDEIEHLRGSIHSMQS